jgi:hypothetical protein
MDKHGTQFVNIYKFATWYSILEFTIWSVKFSGFV